MYDHKEAIAAILDEISFIENHTETANDTYDIDIYESFTALRWYVTNLERRLDDDKTA